MKIVHIDWNLAGVEGTHASGCLEYEHARFWNAANAGTDMEDKVRQDAITMLTHHRPQTGREVWEAAKFTAVANDIDEGTEPPHAGAATVEEEEWMERVE